jgi:hypothetical protein
MARWNADHPFRHLASFSLVGGSPGSALTRPAAACRDSGGPGAAGQLWGMPALIMGERSKTLMTWVILPFLTVRYSAPRKSFAKGVSSV